MKKYIFQIYLADTEFVIFTQQNMLTMIRILSKSWSISDQDPQENVSDGYPLSKLFLPSTD